MPASAQPDFQSECKLIELPASALVEMYNKQSDFADPSGWLGLGSGDLFDLKIPPFQRGLKWDLERLKDFHDSLIQGWPIGTMAIAIESSRTINKASGQRKYSLSLIDGQQRSWAMSSILDGFWSNPWFSFENPKWQLLQPPAGAIIDTRDATVSLASMLGETFPGMEGAIRALSRAGGEGVFEDHVDFLEALEAQLGKTFPAPKQARRDALKLCNALRKQYGQIQQIHVPVLLLNEALHAQLPTIFRRLNAGVPLRGYDLLAATWVSRKLAPGKIKLSPATKTFLKKVLDVSDKRIQESYQKVKEGYVLDPNVDPLQISDLSLFDLLYYLSDAMGQHQCFLFSSDVFAFQVSALTFNGSISRVDNALLTNFPSEPNGSPNVSSVPRLATAAAQQVDNALKPLMDVSSSNLQLKGKVGLTPGVVYVATLLTHHTRVLEESGKLVVRSRNQSAEDRAVAPGWFLTAQERLTTLKETLPSWFVHDALQSVFAGSRAYEAVNERVWSEFSQGKSGSARRRLKASNVMFEFPDLDDLVQAFNRLWRLELSATKTPQRRRVSDTGAVLFRAAYSHLQVHDHQIDHVIPIGKGKASAKMQRGVVYPLNHVANLMPVPADINAQRSDSPWSSFHTRLKASKKQGVAEALMVPWAATQTSKLATLDLFKGFLALRYRALVAQAMTNLGHPDWRTLSQTKRDEFLAKTTA